MKKRRPARGVSPEVAHGKLVLDLEQAESKMRRAFRAWDRALEAVKKSCAKLDRLAKERSQIGGPLSPADFDTELSLTRAQEMTVHEVMAAVQAGTTRVRGGR